MSASQLGQHGHRSQSLAFTGKRPGKTQQFNFFAVNDKPGKEKEVRMVTTFRPERSRFILYCGRSWFWLRKGPVEV
jgi:hypothetical protein